MWLWTFLHFCLIFLLLNFVLHLFWKRFSCPAAGIIMNSSRATNQQREERKKKLIFWPRGERQSGSSNLLFVFDSFPRSVSVCMSEICLQIKCVRSSHTHTHTWKRGCGCSYVISSVAAAAAAAAHTKNWSKCRFLEVCHKTKDKVAVACHMPHAARRMLMQKVLTRA